MTVDASAGNGNGQDNNSGDNNNSGGHPAWQEILDVLPSELHSVVRPTLENWDKGVQQKLQEVRSQYEPYKEFIDNEVDPELIDQSLTFVHQMNSDPDKIIEQAIEAFGLDYVKKAAEEVVQQQNNQQLNLNQGDEYENLGEIKIEDHPFVKNLQKTVEDLQSKFTKQEEVQQQTEQQKAFQAQLDELQEEHGEYDRTFVTALMSQGIDGATAVKQYHDTVNQAAAKLAGNNQNQQQETPPVVMGADGSVGSGIPDQPVSFGEVKDKDLNSLVVQMLENTQKE